MRSLTTLRESCIDSELEYQLATADGLLDSFKVASNYNSTPIFQTTTQISKGFYIMKYVIYFQYDNTEGGIPSSAFHNSLDTYYSDSADVGSPPFYHEGDVDTTNSFVTIQEEANAFKWQGQKLIYVEHNTKDFQVRFKTIDFDGQTEPIDFTGSSSTLQSLAWSDDFTWNDIYVTNTNTTSGNVDESTLTEFQLTEKVVSSDESGAIFNVNVQFQCFTEEANADAGVSEGPLAYDSAIGSCHLILKKDGVEVNRSSFSSASSNGVYRTPLSISARLSEGTYTLFASGCGLYTGGAEAHIGNGRGVVNLLVSRTEGGTKNTYNTDSSLSYANVGVPVFQEVDGQTGSYLYQSIDAGVANCPNVLFDTNESYAQLFRVF